MTPPVMGFLEAQGILRRPAPKVNRWWEVEDQGGFPPFWSHGKSWLSFQETRKPWPSEWDRRPHP